MHMEKTRLHGNALMSQFNWPFLIELWEAATSQPRPSWYLPELVAMSFVDSCDEEASSKLAAALGMVQLAIKLTDDLLDAEPGGVQERVSAGEVANLSNVFQGMAGRLAATAFPNEDIASFAGQTVAALAMETAYGQHLDVADTPTEEAYWLTVKWKSTPFYEAAFALGVMLARYECAEVAGAPVLALGELFGEIVQVIDDLTDIMATPASVDWQRTNNLLVLYAEMTDEDGRFAELKQAVRLGRGLEDAQQYLIDCGAVAYCGHVVKAKYERAVELMDTLGIDQERPLRKLFKSHLNAVDY